jgi:O-antigen/teichoic acid export membrane protein
VSLNRGARVVRDTGYLVAGQAVGAVTGLMFAAWFARHLAAEELSLWPLVVALTSVVHPLSNLGTHTAFMRTIPKLISRGDDRRAAQMLRTAILGTTIVTALVCIAFAPFADAANEFLLKGDLPAGLVELVAIAVFARALQSHYDWFLNGFQAYGMLSIGRTAGRVLRSVAAFVFYLLWGIEGSVWGLVIGSSVGLGICALGLRPYLRAGGGLMPLGEFVRETGPFYLSQVYKGAINRADYIIVGALGGASSLALYYIAYRVIEHLAELDNYIMETLTPKLAEKAVHGVRESEQAFTKCSRYFFMVMLPLHIALAALGPVIIHLYAGPQWVGAGIIFSVLCLHLVLQGFYDLYRRQVVVAANRWHGAFCDS